MIGITTMNSLPNYCYDCPCHDGEHSICEADKDKRSTFEYRPYWCPLKDIFSFEKERKMLDYDAVIEKVEKYEPYAKVVSTITVNSSDFLTILELLRQQKQTIDILNDTQSEKSCSYYAVNRQNPCCTYDCLGCTWYV